MGGHCKASSGKGWGGTDCHQAGVKLCWPAECYLLQHWLGSQHGVCKVGQHIIHLPRLILPSVTISHPHHAALSLTLTLSDMSFTISHYLLCFPFFTNLASCLFHSNLIPVIITQVPPFLTLPWRLFPNWWITVVFPLYLRLESEGMGDVKWVERVRHKWQVSASQVPNGLHQQLSTVIQESH